MQGPKYHFSFLQCAAGLIRSLKGLFFSFFHLKGYYKGLMFRNFGQEVL